MLGLIQLRCDINLQATWVILHSLIICIEFRVRSHWPISDSDTKTRMHSSRMRTGRSLTVCWSLLLGGVCLWERSASLGEGGVCFWRGSVCFWGECLPLGGVCSGGSVCFGGCLLLWGGCLLLGGVCFWGGVCSGRVYSSMHWGRPPHAQNSLHMLVKILPWPNFVAAGKNG